MRMSDNRIAWQKEWEDSCYSGTVTTGGGLVFVGHNDGNLMALDAESGDELWTFQTGAGMNSTVTTFQMDGTQYVAAYSAGNALAGSPHGDSVWLFSLDGTMEQVETVSQEETETVEHYEGQEGEELEEGDAEAGQSVYANNCAACHGPNGEGGRAGPALRGRESAQDFNAVVEQVVNGGGGMPAFGDQLERDQIANVSSYVVERLASEEP
jgi:alcohol dehydrogenase (cytochrome c)